MTTALQAAESNVSEIEDLYELSPMQQGMLFHSLSRRDAGLYIIQMSWGIRGNLRIASFENAWKMMIERHPVLRSGFYWEEMDKPLQAVRRTIEFPLKVLDWRDEPSDSQQELINQYVSEDRTRDFDFSDPPLLRSALIRLAENEYRFIWSFHHILMEGWSSSIVLKELFTYYDALVRGKTIEIKPSRPYRDYIFWYRRCARLKRGWCSLIRRDSSKSAASSEPVSVHSTVRTARTSLRVRSGWASMPVK